LAVRYVILGIAWLFALEARAANIQSSISAPRPRCLMVEGDLELGDIETRKRSRRSPEATVAFKTAAACWQIRSEC
jgi:hypothetical protein